MAQSSGLKAQQTLSSKSQKATANSGMEFAKNIMEDKMRQDKLRCREEKEVKGEKNFEFSFGDYIRNYGGFRWGQGRGNEIS